MNIISLLFLLTAIILGFVKKMNVGLVAMGLSMILGRIGGVSDSAIISGFSSSIFVSIMGITFWFSVINQSGIIELICKKGVMLAGKRQWLIPFAMMALGFIVCFVGPGAVPAVVVCVLSIPLAVEVGVNPLLYVLPSFAGLCAGRISPFTPEGAWTAELGLQQGYEGLVPYITVCSLISALAVTLVVFIYYKGWKNTNNTVKASDIPKMDKNQKICLISIFVMIIMVVVFKVSTALACILIGIVLLLLGVGNEKAALSAMPWGTMILVGGVGLLMVVVNEMGGIALLSDLLSKIMSQRTAASVMGITAGMMSWFSSSFGVVMPTLMPTVPDIIASLGNATGAPLLASITFGASIAGISPFSSGGSMCIGSMSVDNRFDETQINKLFAEFFIWAVVCLVIAAVIAMTGLFDVIAAYML